MRWDAHTLLILLLATAVSACSGGGNDFPESTPTATPTPTTPPAPTATTPTSTSTQPSATPPTTGNGNGGYYYNDPDHEDGEPIHEHDEDGNDIRPARPNRPIRSLGATIAIAPPPTAQIVWDSHGQGLAIWRAFDGTRNDLWADRYNGVSWTGARAIEANAGDVGNAHIALDATGNAIAAWEQETDGSRALWAARFDVVRGWQTPAVISHAPNGMRVDAFAPQVSANADGSMSVRWQQIDGQVAPFVTAVAYARWWENRYTPGLGWSGATLLATP